MYLPTTREGMLAAIGRYIWDEHIEPRTIEMAVAHAAAIASGETIPNPFDTASKTKTARPTAESAMAAVVARVRASKV